ncbi:MAG: RHS repeat-associated core domain-containing protein [Rubrivivax sp.]|nr:RHS repeat-associated core domain-containing protein [Rubrivivax sp.]
MLEFAIRCALSMALLFCASQACAVTGYDEEYKRVGAARTIASYGPDLFGDQVSLYDGSLSFRQVDLTLPGNDALPMAVTRTRAINDFTFTDWHFGDWLLDIPRVHGIYPRSGWTVQGSSPGARCSRFGPPPAASYLNGQIFGPDDYWHGAFLSVPGHGQQEIVKRSTANYRAPAGGTPTWTLVTAAGWQLKCLQLPGNTVNESFIAVSPQGLTYVFGRSMVIAASPLEGGGMGWPRNDRAVVSATGQRLPPAAYFPRNEVWFVVTSVTDRFGNSLTYNYDPSSGSRLTSIVASDGREIRFTYEPTKIRRISKVSDGTREWKYSYNAAGLLSAVTLPDSSNWTYELGSLTYGLTYGSWPTCDGAGSSFPAPVTGTVWHPSGAKGQFTLSTVVHTRAKVWRQCLPLYGNTASNETKAKYPRYFGSLSLQKKEISGPGLSGLQWTYSYSNSNASWSTCTSDCGGTKTVTVTERSGAGSDRHTRHTFGTVWRANEGQLLRLDEGWDPTSGTALRSTENDYQPWAPGQNFMSLVGHGISPGDRFRAENLTPLKRKTVTQQGVRFIWEAGDFDIFGRSVATVRSSSLGYSKSETTRYHDADPVWVLGQMAVRTIDGVEAERITYFENTALPRLRTVFSLPKSEFTHFDSGLRRTVKDGLGQATSYSNYKRGVPQNIHYADGSGEVATVDDLGWIRSIVNEAGTQTAFDYDGMGRLTRIGYPGEDWGGYHPTLFSFTRVDSAELGFEGGHWKQTEASGNRRTERYFDAMWRMRLERTWDLANPAGTSRTSLFDYDADGRNIKESYPKATISSIHEAVPGHRRAHDALGRETLHQQDSEIGVLTTTTEYLDNFRKRVTNARGQATTFSYQAWDTPSEDGITDIQAPEGVALAMARDAFGKPLTITRAGAGASATRRYVYDAHQRLCKTVEPESGATVQGYDAAGNLAWRASGQNFPGPGCETQVAGSSLVHFGYDLRNRLLTTTYGDGGQNITRNYTADGLLSQISAIGASNPITWTYSYNNRRLLTQERYTWGDPNNGWNFTWAADAYGHVSSLTDPWGTVHYAPDALGRPTQVSGYASGVSYHPNGAVAGYTLGNGIAHVMTQNLRGLPELMQHGSVVRDRYAYDANGNVTAISDEAQAGVNSRSMPLYDGLDRLRQANGPWGAGSFSYDALDNLVASTVGTRSLTHHIDPTTNRLTGISGSQSLAIGYDANGNVVQRGAQGFSFDIGNRMTSAAGKASYVYDGHGRRNLVWFAGGEHMHQAYTQDGKLRFAWRPSEGGRRHVFLGDRLIAETTEGGLTTYAHTDGLGSPVAKASNTGAVVSRTRYEPHGATVAGSTNPTTIGYTGHVNDPDTGLVYMQQRYYDPIAVRFLSVDPVTTDERTGDGFGRYVYANNNPYRFKDPDGRWAEDLVLGLPSLVMGSANFIKNLQEGDFAAATVDAIGMALDTAAIIVPGIPGGVGLAVVGARAASGSAAKVIGRETIVIGEGQASRVIPTAKEAGADWYRPRNGAAENFMRNNKRWINRKMDKGCRILDCGAAPGRKSYPRPTSPNYKMELEQIEKQSYPTKTIKAVGE